MRIFGMCAGRPSGSDEEYQVAGSNAPPIFFSILPKRKRAAPGPKEKNATAGRSAQSAYLRPPAGDGWPFRVSASSNAMPLGKPWARGGPGYPALLFPLALARRLTRADEGVGPYGTVLEKDLCVRVTATPVGADAHIRPLPELHPPPSRA